MYKLKLGLLWAFLLVAHIVRADDIIITNELELRDLAGGNSYEGQTIYLANDISLTSVWTPIGTAEHPFMGHFEGWGHKISGLSIPEGGDCQGLFGYISGGSVRDVAVVGTSSITGGQYVGAICGYLDGGEISSCYSEADVTGTTYVGGICGSSTGKVRDCYVSGSGSVNSTATGGVNVGGIVGCSSGVLQTGYMVGTMSVSGSSYYGAIVGHNQGGTVEKCIFNSEVIGEGFYAIGGGEEYGAPQNDDAQKVTGATTTDMQTKTEETDFWASILDYTAWKMVNGHYPCLYSFQKNEPITFTFTSTKNWQTIVPNGNYAVPEGMEAYIVTAVGDEEAGWLTLSRVYTLNEGRGALLYCETSVEREFTVNSTDTPLSDYSRDIWLKGSHVSPVTIGWPNHYDYVLVQGQFKRARSGSLARGKAYLHLGDQVQGSRDVFELRFDNEPTGVVEVESKDSTQPAYDLGGRRVQGATKRGLVIQYGKKTIK